MATITAPIAGDAQHAESVRADLEHVAGEYRQEASRATQQYCEQVQRDRPEDQLVPPQVQ